jgi:PAS domain S-box-containing protein
LPPAKVYTTADGLFGNPVFAVFEDSRGDIWLSAGDADNSLLRWEKATGKFSRYTTEDGLPKSSGASVFGEDAGGNVWIGFFFGQLARYRDGKFRLFKPEDGIPQGGVSDMLLDKSGRLWLATTSRGLFRVDEAGGEAPRFTNLSTAHGLSSNQALCLAEDSWGRIYAGTGGGINRIEPESGRIKVFNQEDGLPGNIIYQCYADAAGQLWFSSSNSLIRFSPQAGSSSKPPPVFIASLSVNGTARQVSELGETEIKNLAFAPDEHQIQIGFFGVSLNQGERLRYQYKLEGQDWSAPAEQRTVSLDLSAGDYVFSVQAVNSDGAVSENPATISFRILPPVWQRWWFLTLAFLLTGAGVFALDRYRVAKTRQIQKALAESRESETRFRTLAETASDAILTIDRESRILFVNQATAEIFGYRTDELIGQKLTMLMPERMRGRHDAGLGNYLKTNEKHINWSGVELPGLHKSGAEIPLEVSFGEFEREGERYFTGIARDVSERRKAEEALQKAREEKFRELERVRARIATDLHDDIGSSLTQIAVLTEVARGQAINLQAENLSTPLERIKNVSKELVAVMSDVVWAINPQKDFLHDLVQRMRRFASDVFTTRGIKFEFIAPEIEGSLQLGANIRREVFAIFKESVNNAVKYSECTAARAEFRIEESRLILKISDNGKGFDTDVVLSGDFKPEMGGNGLINMRKRARDLGGECRIESETGNGTVINLIVPLHISQNGLEK